MAILSLRRYQFPLVSTHTVDRPTDRSPLSARWRIFGVDRFGGVVDFPSSPTPSLPKYDIEILNDHRAFACRIWGGCPPKVPAGGRAGRAGDNLMFDPGHLFSILLFRPDRFHRHMSGSSPVRGQRFSLTMVLRKPVRFYATYNPIMGLHYDATCQNQCGKF
jgi:hypothetical protein